MSVVKVDSDAGGIVSLLREVNDIAERWGRSDLVKQIGEWSKSIIQLRTLQGIDAEYRGFKPYSQMWAKVRHSFGLPTSPVDLWFTGTMLDAMKVVGGGEEAEIMFTDHDSGEIAMEHTEGIGVPQREFFAFSLEEVEEMAKQLLYGQDEASE